MASAIIQRRPVIYSTKYQFLGVAPPEIRNYIYQLAFSTPDSKIELDTASPPSKALLLTCRQVYAEAKNVYRAAYRDFWSKTHFYVSLPTGRDETGAHDQYLSIVRDFLRARNIAHITKITVRDSRAEWTYPDGEWNVSRDAAGHANLRRPYLGHRLIVVPDSTFKRVRVIGKGPYWWPCKFAPTWSIGRTDRWTREEIEEVKRKVGVPKFTAAELMAFIAMLGYEF